MPQKPKQPAKAKKRWRRPPADKSRQRPLDIQALQAHGALKDVAPPSGPFDPAADWEQVYQNWLVSSPKRYLSGYTRVRHTIRGDTVLLQIESDLLQQAGTLHQTRATITCASDALYTPLAWELESKLLDLNDESIKAAHVAQKAVVTGSVLRVQWANGERTMELPARCTTHWSLFAAVQRLPGKATKPLAFAVLEELDLLKEGQRLTFAGKLDVEWKAAKLVMNEYHQTGRAVLPHQYWVAEHGRLAAVTSGVRAYILDPTAQGRFQERVEKQRAWQRKRSKA